MKGLKILGTGLLALTMNSCYNDAYDYSGTINGEKISVNRNSLTVSQYGRLMEIQRNDSISIYFYSSGNRLNNDTLLERTIIKVNGESKVYDDNEFGHEVMVEARKQHQKYLNDVLNEKKTEGLRYLKK